MSTSLTNELARDLGRIVERMRHLNEAQRDYLVRIFVDDVSEL